MSQAAICRGFRQLLVRELCLKDFHSDGRISVRRQKAWTKQDEAVLLEMRAAAASWEAIAAFLDRTKMSVEVRAAEIKRRNADISCEAS